MILAKGIIRNAAKALKKKGKRVPEMDSENGKLFKVPFN